MSLLTYVSCIHIPAFTFTLYKSIFLSKLNKIMYHYFPCEVNKGFLGISRENTLSGLPLEIPKNPYDFILFDKTRAIFNNSNSILVFIKIKFSNIQTKKYHEGKLFHKKALNATQLFSTNTFISNTSSLITPILLV